MPDANSPHVLVVSRYDNEKPPQVFGEYPSWNDAYEAQQRWIKRNQEAKTDLLGWFLSIVPLQEAV